MAPLYSDLLRLLGDVPLPAFLADPGQGREAALGSFLDHRPWLFKATPDGGLDWEKGAWRRGCEGGGPAGSSPCPWPCTRISSARLEKRGALCLAAAQRGKKSCGTCLCRRAAAPSPSLLAPPGAVEFLEVKRTLISHLYSKPSKRMAIRCAPPFTALRYTSGSLSPGIVD